MACEFKDGTGRWIRANIIAVDPAIDAVQLDVNPGAWQKSNSSRLRPLGKQVSPLFATNSPQSPSGPFFRHSVACNTRSDGPIIIQKGGVDHDTLKKWRSDRRDVASPPCGGNEIESFKNSISRQSSSSAALPTKTAAESVVVISTSGTRRSDKDLSESRSNDCAAPVPTVSDAAAALALTSIPAWVHMGTTPHFYPAASVGQTSPNTSPKPKRLNRHDALGSLALTNASAGVRRRTSSSPLRDSSSSPRRSFASVASPQSTKHILDGTVCQQPIPKGTTPSEESAIHAGGDKQLAFVPKLPSMHVAKTQLAAQTTAAPTQTTGSSVTIEAGSSVVVDAGPSVIVETLSSQANGGGSNVIGRAVNSAGPDTKIVNPIVVSRFPSTGTHPAGREKAVTPPSEFIANSTVVGAGSNALLHSVDGELANMKTNGCSVNEDAADIDGAAGASVRVRPGGRDRIHIDSFGNSVTVHAADINATKPVAVGASSSALVFPRGREWASANSNGCSVTTSAPDTIAVNPVVLGTRPKGRVHPAGRARTSTSPSAGCSVTVFAAPDPQPTYPIPPATNLKVRPPPSREADSRRHCQPPQPRPYPQQYVSPPFQHQQKGVVVPIAMPSGVGLAPVASVPLSGPPCAATRSDHLERIIAPGDVFFTQGNVGYLASVGAAGGFMGHVSVVISPPKSVMRNTPEATLIQEAWPSDDVSEVWRVQTAECTRAESGLYQSDTILYVDPITRRLIITGDVTELQSYVNVGVSEEPVAVELWHSPPERRSQLNPVLMAQVLQEMSDGFSNWSVVSAMRAMLFSSSEMPEENMLAEVQECWHRKPICTSVVIVFWQRYLCKLADLSGGVQRAIDLIRECMPVKADRTLPHDLLTAMRETGWTSRSLVPVVA